VVPREVRIAEQFAEPAGHRDQPVRVRAARLDEQHVDSGVGGQAIRERAPRRSGPDDHIVGHADSVCRRPAAANARSRSM
jgi:hypothetical protein